MTNEQQITNSPNPVSFSQKVSTQTVTVKSAENDETLFESKLIDDDKQIEIVNGNLEIKAMGSAKSGGVASRIGSEIWFFAKVNKLGRVYGADTAFTIGENERMPDVAFVAQNRIPKTGEPEKKWDIAPDLAIEVISPNDIYFKVLEKLENYFAAGVKQVWLVEPQFEKIKVYNSPGENVTFSKNDELICEQVLPDFRLKLTDIFID